MAITKLVKLSKKGQVVIPQEIREKMGIKTGERLVIFIRGYETVMLTPQKYAEYTCGLMKGTWGSTKKEVEEYINEERGSWK
ncbi:MAG: AbrB/MazE/SpoVT family DNA-binding domain-containing protein [Actinomycetia bacterium]|nr:AbrB/MazE/SpoVT family DNA-binding domain-containing protein [Actinomycetes bacterium]